MFDSTTLFVVAVLVLGGFVKGVIGLGLPAISMGLLATAMPPAEAATILIVPSVVTNLWQMATGPQLSAIARRLWPCMAGVVVGTLAGAGWLTGGGARYGTALLGVTLAAYAILGLASIRFAVSRSTEVWLGPITGVATGLLTAATGVFAIPAVPYLQAIGLEKEDLVQALGLSFTVSTLALAVNLASVSALGVSHMPIAVTALLAACVGMVIGQLLRLRLSPVVFRKVFFAGLLALGFYLTLRAIF